MANKRILTFDEILAARDLEEKEVYVAEWNGHVKIRSMTKAEQQAMRKEASVNGQVDPDKLEIIMLAHCLIEPQVTIEQAEKLKDKSAAAVDKVLREILSIAGLTEEVQKEALKSFRSRP